jgi:sugar O-acyltransferase (sialic acid O-acetyltransferase NeuD family)
MQNKRHLIIIGDSSFAEVAYEYFTHDSNYQVVAFSVEKKYLMRDQLFGLPVVPFEELTQKFNPTDHDIFVAVIYTQLNRLRTRLYLEAKACGYGIASYISSRAFVWPNVKFGEHCFVFENNTVQPFVTVGNNVVLWSGNHIGHHSRIKDNNFISSHVVISGHCEVGENCFIGVNATVADGVKIAKDCLIGAGAIVLKYISQGQIYKSIPTEPSKISSYKFFKISEEDKNNAVV